MAFKVWVILFIAFIAFSWMIYAHCDDKNTEGAPNNRVLAGWKTWQDKNCQSCHQLYGLGGYMGLILLMFIQSKGRVQIICKHSLNMALVVCLTSNSVINK